MKTFLGSIVIASILVGCGVDDTAPPVSRTELLRQQLGLKTRSYLSGAQMALESGAMKQALVMSDSAVRNASELADAHFIRARVLSTVKRYQEAEAEYNRALELDPDYLEAAFNLGNLAYGQGRYGVALAYYLKALRWENIWFMRLEALPADLDPSGRVTGLVQLGKTYLALDRTRKARRAFELAGRIDSTSALLNDALREFYERQGQLDRALEAARRAYRYSLDPDRYRFELARLLVATGRDPEAIPLLEELVAEEPWHAKAHRLLGEALARTGRADESARYLDRVPALQRWQAAIDSLSATIERAPDDVTSWLHLGKAYIDAGRYDEAVGAFDYLLQFWPEEVDAWYHLGVAQLQRQDTTMARFALRSALRLDPTHEAATRLLEELAR